MITGDHKNTAVAIAKELGFFQSDSVALTGEELDKLSDEQLAQQVQKVEGNTLQVKYKDGEKTIVVPKDAEVVNLVPGSKDDLKTGAHVFIPRWEKQGDGTWMAAVVVVGRDGITPPM